MRITADKMSVALSKEGTKEDLTVFIYNMLIWLNHKEKGVPLPAPMNFFTKQAIAEWSRPYEELYEDSGSEFMYQVAAECKERGLIYDPDEFAKRLIGGNLRGYK